ncbi:membrane-bound transcription factor site-2 protease homolog isoform X2 [Ananas comosus]|uniref:Endopeptidase S2P n=1 Tax=Ananas comosus TaxID=4615 RepID=A0A6P5FQ63_ANACO|nr:membrane-bound transcription factor site-2 protease homolog isoform X2 [Ananas comosus]
MYCDFKIYALNNSLFYVGYRYARYLKVWFSLGVFFVLAALIGVSMMLLWDLAGAFHFHGVSFGLENILASGLSISVTDAAVVIVSTFISVAFHEFGHAVASASEGLQIEYIAIFLAILFPGALIALNYDQLQTLPPFAALRIYCAGVWHNAVFCAVCALALFLLPLVLSPLYTHGEGPIVLGIPHTSPLSGYLSLHDVIVSVDGTNITNPDDWMKMMAKANSQIILGSPPLENSQSYKAIKEEKGYCVPNSWIEASKIIQEVNDNFSCPDDFVPFVQNSCINSSLSDGSNLREETEHKHCLIAKDVIKLKKCGNGWQIIGTDGNSCICSEQESCMTPVQIPGMTWVEVSYKSPYSPNCLQLTRNLSSKDSVNLNLESNPCDGTFVFIGDVVSVARSIQLSSYQPRWAWIIWSIHIPHILEKVLVCMLHMSAALGLINCLPVYFLDGESILETSICYITWLTRRQRHKVLSICLFGGTVLSIITFAKMLYSLIVLQ